MTRRRCVSPSDHPGSWHSEPNPTHRAMREAAWIAYRRHDLDAAEVSALWQGLKRAGWRIETERPME